MNLQVGSANQRLPGFVNVDIRQVDGVDVIGHAGRLPSVADGAVEILFSSAVFEHMFAGQHVSILAEWERVLAPTGIIVTLGIPDFAVIAELYLRSAPGIAGPRFDVYNVFRYTHGMPEIGSANVWSTWRPDDQPDTAPAGWLPQLHKAVFDARYLTDLLEYCGLPARVFNYAFPGEGPRLNLGFIATAAHGVRRPPTTMAEIATELAHIPGIDRFADLTTLEPSEVKAGADLMLAYVTQGEALHRSRRPRMTLARSA